MSTRGWCRVAMLLVLHGRHQHPLRSIHRAKGLQVAGANPVVDRAPRDPELLSRLIERDAGAVDHVDFSWAATSRSGIFLPVACSAVSNK